MYLNYKSIQTVHATGVICKQRYLQLHLSCTAQRITLFTRGCEVKDGKHLTLNTCLNTMSMKFEIVHPTWRFEKARKKFVPISSCLRAKSDFYLDRLRYPLECLETFFSITPNSSIMKSNNKFSHTLREGSPKTKRLKYTLNV